jgi:hypothetical protein
MTGLTYDELASFMKSLPDLASPRLELHLHPFAWQALKAQSVPVGQEREWMALAGGFMRSHVPVFTHEDMSPGTWELRLDGQVIESGSIRPTISPKEIP